MKIKTEDLKEILMKIENGEIKANDVLYNNLYDNYINAYLTNKEYSEIYLFEIEIIKQQNLEKYFKEVLK